MYSVSVLASTMTHSCAVFFIFMVFVIYNVNSQCVWNLNVDLPKSDPIYFVSANLPLLVVPTSAGLTLQDNESMTLVCAGKSNTVFGTGLQEITAKCVSNNMLLYNGQQYALNSLYCASNTQSDVVLTGTPCGNSQGEIMNLGFNSTKGFNTLITTCYDRIKETNIYSTNIIHGKSIATAENENDRPGFRTPGLTNGTITGNQYKQTEQTKRFTLLLGATQANTFITDSSFLARGHVSPDADFDFGSWSIATYFFVNAAPQWQVVNAGNWLRVENIARAVAEQYQEDVVITSGIHGVLQLPNQSGQMINMYLMDNNKLRVPKFYWKIIYSPLTLKGIAFVTLNNPHVTSINPSELICPNICATTGWVKPEWNDFSRGFTYCCDVNQLISAVGTLSPMSVTGYITGTF